MNFELRVPDQTLFISLYIHQRGAVVDKGKSILFFFIVLSV